MLIFLLTPFDIWGWYYFGLPGVAYKSGVYKKACKVVF